MSKVPHIVGIGADCAEDAAGCCGCTVTARCPGCPYAGSDRHSSLEEFLIKSLPDPLPPMVPGWDGSPS